MFVKVTVVIIFIALAFSHVNSANWHPFIPEATAPGVYGWGGIFRAASIIFFAHSAFNYARIGHELPGPRLFISKIISSSY